jgi:hypothetical protein
LQMVSQCTTEALMLRRRLAVTPSCSIPPSAFEAAERRASARGCSTSYSPGSGSDARSGTACGIASMPRRGFLLHAAGLLSAAAGLHARRAQVGSLPLPPASHIAYIA